MIRRRTGDSEHSSMSFLDVVSCGFGAIILLLLITDNSPIRPTDTVAPEPVPISELQQQLFAIRGETTVVNEDLNAKREQLSAVQDRIANLRRELYAVQSRFENSDGTNDARIVELQRLASAKQSLSEEMERLLGEDFERTNNLVGG